METLPDYATDEYLLFHLDIIMQTGEIPEPDYYYKQIKKDKYIRICQDCNKELIPNSGYFVCINCGLCEMNIVLSEKMIESGIYKIPYKEISHFKELISQKQGKQLIDIPLIIKHEFEKYKNEHVNIRLARKIIRDCGYQKLNEHVIYIMHKCLGTPILKLSRYEENELLKMYKLFLREYKKNNPIDRKSFLNLNMLIHYFLLKKGWNDHLEFFPILKCKKQRVNQEIIMGEIFKNLGW